MKKNTLIIIYFNNKYAYGPNGSEPAQNQIWLKIMLQKHMPYFLYNNYFKKREVKNNFGVWKVYTKS
jgi:hypothetical protein